MFELNELTWNNITIEVKTKGKNLRILDNVSGKAKAGRMHIIMGPSGSGKSTLINTLMGHVPFEFRTSGEILVDDAERKNSFKSMVGLCDQQDAYFDHYTVFDFLKFHSFGKNRNFDENESEERINFLLRRLKLDNKRDTLVSKLSGGERKRVVLISELMTKKKVIFLDEPTSGLDSHLALDLIHFLKEITIKDNLLMFVTIHQPSPTIVNMFDDFTFIAWGRVMYHGEYAKCEQFFADHGFVKPSHITFTEYLFELTCEKSCFDEIVPNLDKVQSLLPPTDLSPVNSNKSNYIFETKVNYKVISALFKRMLSNYFKNTNILTMMFSLLLYGGYFFSILKFRSEIIETFESKEGGEIVGIAFSALLYFTTIFSFFVTSIHQRCISFCLENRQLLKSEIKNNSYSISELLVSLVLLCCFQSVALFILFSIIINAINIYLSLLIFFILLPFVFLFTLVSILISFLIPFIAPFISVVVHSLFLILSAAMVSKSLLEGGSVDITNIPCGSLIMFIGMAFQFFPDLLYNTMIRNIYFINFAKCFKKNTIDYEHIKTALAKKHFKAYILMLSGYIGDKYHDTWRFLLSAAVAVLILYLLAINLTYSLKVRLLIPFRYRLQKK
ncbi:hypothetical protein H312_03010 [Anncaliia algerae PRA339]|uniref:ABC transporter domain-containing protein n=2 Tax=Anncaliia algerae PRA339 TaxID=1288291 RepID=A0A059EX68_9MICR|nr:hypothetical protein H312_03010 [Anncaliia algerae PRA339]